MSNLDEHYWTDRYLTDQIGWDLGQVSPPLSEFIDQFQDKEARILIPGCGNAHELRYLLDSGFKSVTVIDISEAPLRELKEQYSDLSQNLIHGDFFEHIGEYDLILEQTFFCALAPTLREKYVNKMNELLADNGLLVGLLFNRNFENEGPPFGGDETEYRSLFNSRFRIEILEPCLNSIGPRLGHELFFKIRKI